MTKAYSYLRFSTAEQAKGDSHRRQLQLSRDYAVRHDLQLDEDLSFHDLGVSAFQGRNASTGRLADFLQAVKSGLVERGSFLLVENLDRLSRRTARKALSVLESIVDEGICVVTLSDGKEYTSETLDGDPLSLIYAILIFIRANDESALKSTRIRASWAGKRALATSRPISARGPAWLRLSDDRSSWEVVSDRALVIQRIYSSTAAGLGEHSITAMLNRDGIPTWGDNGRPPASMWHRSYVSKILRSPAVVGTLVPHTIHRDNGRTVRKALQPVPGYYPAIISHDLWQSVQELKATGNPRGRHSKSLVQNVLGGLAKCSKCGSTMTRICKGARQPVAKLVCTKAKTGSGCVYHPIPLDAIEAALKGLFKSKRTEAAIKNSAYTYQAMLKKPLARIDEIEALVSHLTSNSELVKREEVQMQILSLLREKDNISTRLDLVDGIQRFHSESFHVTTFNKLHDLFKCVPLDKGEVNRHLRVLFTKVDVMIDLNDLECHTRLGVAQVLSLDIQSSTERLRKHAASGNRRPDGRFASKRAEI